MGKSDLNPEAYSTLRKKYIMKPIGNLPSLCEYMKLKMSEAGEIVNVLAVGMAQRGGDDLGGEIANIPARVEQMDDGLGDNLGDEEIVNVLAAGMAHRGGYDLGDDVEQMGDDLGDNLGDEEIVNVLAAGVVQRGGHDLGVEQMGDDLGGEEEEIVNVLAAGVVQRGGHDLGVEQMDN